MNSPPPPALISTLTILHRQYYALVPPFALRLPLPHLLALPYSQSFLVEHMVNPSLTLGVSGPSKVELNKHGCRIGAVGQYPPPEIGYQRSFWRRILAALERGVGELQALGEESEVDERIYEAMAEIMGGPVSFSSAPGKSFKTFIYDQPQHTSDVEQREKNVNDHESVEQSVTLLEEQVAVQAGTTGLRTWTASLHLGHHILHSPKILFGSQGPGIIVELGAGTGFLSILIAQQGMEVISTDLGDEDENNDVKIDPQWAERGDRGRDDGCQRIRQTPLERLRANIALNRLDKPPTVLSLDWSDSSRPSDERPCNWKKVGKQIEGIMTIIAADVVYDPELVPLLVTTISILLETPHLDNTNDDVEGSQSAGRDDTLSPFEQSSSRQAILAATIRNEETFSFFLEACTGLQVQMISLDPVDVNNPTFWDTALDGGARVEVVRITR